MDRISRARQAFNNKDLDQVKASHTAQIIKKQFAHQEKHTTGFNLPEIILGGQDGLVNVLGIILGMAAATASNKIVLVAGLAATFAESISMAAVAYTSKLAEADHYQSEYERERWEVENYPQGEREEIRAIYRQLGLTGRALDQIVRKITADKQIWIKTMMEDELELKPVDRREAVAASLIVGTSALIGSFIPLLPFIFLPVRRAM